jgi:hypothetical protein
MEVIIIPDKWKVVVDNYNHSLYKWNTEYVNRKKEVVPAKWKPEYIYFPTLPQCVRYILKQEMLHDTYDSLEACLLAQEEKLQGILQEFKCQQIGS